jgi:cell division protein FtsQ
VVEAIGIDHGDPLVTLDLAAAGAAVRALPWVEEVTVSRVWPGTVEVIVVERTPAAALVQEGEQVALVDDEAQVLDLVPPGTDDVVVVRGLPLGLEPGQVVGGAGPAAIALAGSIPPDLRPRVSELVVTPDGRLELGLLDEDGDPAGLVRFGDGSLLADKLRALVTMLTHVDLDGLEVLDLEVPGAPALTRR